MKITKPEVELFTDISDCMPTYNESIFSMFYDIESVVPPEFFEKISTIFDFETSQTDFSDIYELYISHYGSLSPSYILKNYLRIYLQRYGAATDRYYALSMEGYHKLCKMIYMKYSDKWNKLLDTLMLNYDILKPFSINSQDKVIRDHLESSSTDSGGSTTNSNSGRYAFNSDNSVPVDTSTDSFTRNLQNSYERDNQKERTISRAGNIGNKSNAELIKGERDMLKWNFFEEMFIDINKIIGGVLWN